MSRRKRTNFCLQETTIERLNAAVPKGDRSRFIDEAVRNALKNLKRRKAK
jgi:hypothetical protein